MNNVLGFLEAKLMPLAAKTAQQRHLGAIRGAYVSFMPFIIVGSILLVISSFPNLNLIRLVLEFVAMEIKLHANATTTPRIRRYLQQSDKSDRELAVELGICV